MLKKYLPEHTLTEGYYDILRDDDLIGHEYFHVHPLSMGFLLKGELEFEFPSEHALTYEYQVTREWAPVVLRTSLEAGDIARRGSLRNEPLHWVSAVRDTDGSTTRETLELGGAEVDFASPVFNMVTLLRHRLEVSQSKDFDVAFVEIPSLSTAANRLRYHVTGEQLSGGEGKQWKGRKYTITDLGGSAPTELIVHRSGIILEHTTRIAGATQKTLLSEWDQQFDWPVLW